MRLSSLMRPMAIAAMCVFAGTLAACQKADFVGSDWAPNTLEASRLSYDGDISVITARDWKRRPAGTQERLRFKNGASIFYEELYGGNTVWQMKDAQDSLRHIFDSFNKQAGGYQPGDIARKEYNDFNLFHMSAVSDTQKCFIGEASSDKSRGGWHFVLTMCRTLRDTSVARLDADAIDIVNRLRFDGGVLNKAKAAGLMPVTELKS